VVEDLVQVMHDQARGLEALVDHLGQAVGRRPDGADLSVVRFELAAPHVRAKRLVAAACQRV